MSSLSQVRQRAAVLTPVALLLAATLGACSGGGAGDGGSTTGGGTTGGGTDGGTTGGGGGTDGSGTIGGTTACTVFDTTRPDTDGDGLPDCYEITLGTSPADADSDGDGLTDYDEVVSKAFDASINNFQFNPRIADVPEISVQLQSVPDISVNFTDSSSTSQTRSITSGSRRSSTLTTSDTYEQSVGEEVSGTIGTEATFPGFGLSSSTTYSVNQQETMSWTTEQARENESFEESTREETSETGVNNASGDINVLVRVRNHGYQTVTLSSLTLTAMQVSSLDPTRQSLVSGMDYDTSFGQFPVFDIAPNGESNSLPFRATLSLGKTYDLLANSRNLSVVPTTWNITDQDGRSYTHNLTTVGARAARVVIDYAGAQNRGIETYYVATVTDFGQNRISAARALGDVLNVDYTEGRQGAGYNGAYSGLMSVRNVANNDSRDGRWIVVHHHLDNDGITRVKETWDSANGAYSLDDIRLAKGETLHLMYVEDKDGDGIGSREEFLHGTSDSDADTDNDGLTDYDEIRGGWQVPVTRTLSRTVYSDPTEKDADNDALEDGAERANGTNPWVRDTDSDGILDNADTPLTVADMQERAYLPLAEGNIVDAAVNSNTMTTGAFDHAADRFGVPGGAAWVSDGASHQIDISGVFDSEPTVGASLVFWIKVDPRVTNRGWALYEHAGSETASQNPGLADQWFVVQPDAFTIMGDCCARHSFFPVQNSLFDSYSFADWHMVAVIADDVPFSNPFANTGAPGMNRYQVYFDGDLYGSVVSDEPLVRYFPEGNWTFAGDSNYGDDYLGGIDDVRFFARSLDAEEIRVLMEEGY